MDMIVKPLVKASINISALCAAIAGLSIAVSVVILTPGL
jgi:hypothetical protein